MASSRTATETARVSVTRTAKIFVGGWVRPESGRVVRRGAVMVPVASRKDTRDAVRIARKALAGWSGATPYLRGQVLYRLAEMLESRAATLAAELVETSTACGVRLSRAQAEVVVAETIDAVVHYAGWTDKLGYLCGAVNAVSAPFLSVTAPTPSGVVAAFPAAATPAGALRALVDAICAPLAAGATVVAVVPTAVYPALVSVTEALATCDLPAGTVSVLPTDGPEVALTLSAHTDVDCFDAEGLDDELTTTCFERAAEALTRVRHAGSDPSPAARLRWVTEARTVWLPQAL